MNLTPGSPRFITGDPLPLYNTLDPRPFEEYVKTPYRNAVNIPLEELRSRVFELPPKGVELEVVGEDGLVQQTIGDLAELGRLARPAPRFQFAEAIVLGRLWRPNSYIEDFALRVPPKTAIDIACGAGRDAVFLASRGWSVQGIDRLPEALDLASQLAARYLPGIRRAGIEERTSESSDPIREIASFSQYSKARLGPELCFHCLDILRSPIDFGQVEVVCCGRFFDPKIPAIAASLLQPGGILLVQAFSENHRLLHGRPSRTRVLPNDLSSLFSPSLWSIEEEKEVTEQGCQTKCVALRYSPNGEA